MEFINKSGQELIDISSEQYREYFFSVGETVRIDSPLRLNISERGHLLFDASGQSHYIPFGWRRLTWKAKEGPPHFVK